jgi:TolB protein
MASCIKQALKFIAVTVLFMPAAVNAQYEYIDINKPFLRKIPMAIPVFVSLSEPAVDQQELRHAADLLADMLAFTGYFKMLDRDAFLIDSQKPPITKEDIKFHNWTSIGAELLITGGMVKKGDLIDLELRLFDAISGQRLVGKRYHGTAADMRQIIRRFCGTVIYQLTGNRGVFDSKIAFVSTGNGHKEIYICEFDGYKPVQLTYHKKISMFPAWSSDGDWLAYTAYVNDKPDIYIKQINGKRTAVIDKKGINMTPAWVPGKLVLAATLSFTGNQEIYLLTETGKIIKRITKNWASDLSPNWSRDANKMAFVSSRSGSPQIYIKDFVSDRIERLTFEGGYNTQPSWSPTSNRIAYTSTTNGFSDIFVIDLENREPVQLTRESGSNESPSWSPDGTLIVFSSTREGSSRLYVMTAYGTDQRRLLTLPGEQSNPSWSPTMSKH